MNGIPWPRRALSRPKVEAELDEELGFHLEMAQRELEAGGAQPGEAAGEARERFGNVARVRRECLEIANGEQTMIKNILLAASLVVIVTLSLMCVHFYNVARAAKQDAIMQRVLLEQEVAKVQSMSGFLQNVFVTAELRPMADVRVVPLIEAANTHIDRAVFTPDIEMQLRAATQATQPSDQPQSDRSDPPPQ